MAIDWKAFYANGGYSNENSDPQSYDDEDDYDDEYEGYDDHLLLGRFYRYICFWSILATLWMAGCGRGRSCLYRSFLAC